MILRRVSLENFISHRSSDLEFDYGINVITGPNGAGKTSILDAVSFGLFNIHSRGKKENLINRRAESSRVFVEFTEGGVNYAVEWTIGRKKPANGVLFKVQDGEKFVIAKGGERVITSEVEKIIGLDKNLFLQSIYVQQGEIERFVTETPAVRKEIISKLLGIEDLEKAYQFMRDVIGDYQRAVSKLSGELERKPTVENQIRSLGKELEELKALFKSEAAKLSKIEEELSIMEKELRELDQKEKQFQVLSRQKAVLESEVDKLDEQIKSKGKELEEAEKAFKIIEMLQEAVAKLPLLESYVCLLQKLKDKERDRKQERERLEHLDSLKNKMAENEQSYQSYQEKSTVVNQKRAERKNYEGANEGLKRVKRQLQQDEKKRDKKSRDLSQKLDDYSHILGEKVTVENVETVLSNKRKKLEKLKEELEEKAGGLKLEIGSIKGQLKDIEFKLSQISEADICPICKRELTPEHKLKLQSEFEELCQKSNEKKKVLEAEVKRVDAEKESCEKKLRNIASINPEIIEGLIKEIGELDEKIVQGQSELKELEKKAEALEKIDGEIKKLESELDELKEAYQEYEAAKRELVKWPTREEVEANLKQINEEISAILREIETLSVKLGYKPEDPQKELADLHNKKVEFDRNELLAKRKDSLFSKVQEIRHDLEAKRLKLDKVISSISELAYDENNHRKKREGYKAKEQEKNDVAKEKVRIETEIKRAGMEKEKCERELAQLQEKEKEKVRIEGFVKILEAIREAFHKDGIQRLIRARSKPLLEKITRDFFERFNLEFSDVQIDDDYNISVIGPAGVQTIDQISGGERVALAIALRLAIARILSEKVETVIMDEPTTHLDEERRKELVNILNSFFREGGRIIPQMIVITHHHEIEDVADVVYLVKKEEGYSSVESPSAS